MSWIRQKKPSTTVRPLRGRLSRWRERLSIQTHLAYCELKLRLRTRPDQATRLQLLDHLHQYWQAGRFPENKLHTPGGRQPIFIDDRGVYCAVGYLMAQSGANDLASQINRDNRFVYIEDLDLDQQPELHRWLVKHELNQTEAALIQPTYGGDGMPGSTDPQLGFEGLLDLFKGTGSSVLDIALVIWLILSLGLLLLASVLIRVTRRLREDKFAFFCKRLGFLAFIATLNLVFASSLAFVAFIG